MSENVGHPDAGQRPELVLQERWNRWRVMARRRRLSLMVLVAVVAAAVALPIGRATAPTENVAARQSVEQALLPLALDAEGIWSSGSSESPAVSDAFVAFRNDGDPRPILDHAERWLRTYDDSLERIAALDLPATARPVQRQFIAAITLSRDAVEVLRHAAAQDDVRLRRTLTTEAGRLRQRGEQLTQSARASAGDLGRGRADVTPLDAVTSFPGGL